jgi:hypothetical protein
VEIALEGPRAAVGVASAAKDGRRGGNGVGARRKREEEHEGVAFLWGSRQFVNFEKKEGRYER